MDLLQNPFHILNASPRDNRRRIMELADERSLLLDSRECMEASSKLTTPRKRLSAEVAWLPGIGPKRAGEMLSLLESSPTDLLAVDKLSSIARANLLAAGLARLPDCNADDVADWILEISWAFEGIDPEDLCVIINEERVVSGFPEVVDISAVESEIQEMRRHYRQVIKSALDNLSPKELVEAVTVAVESATDDGEEHGPILIDDLVDSYELEARGFLEKEEGNIRLLIDKIRQILELQQCPKCGHVQSDQDECNNCGIFFHKYIKMNGGDTTIGDGVLSPSINQLIQIVKNWDTVAQPIQLSTKSRGLDHDASRRVAGLVRSLAIDIFNEHDKIDFSQQLTNMLQEVFAEVVDVAERTAKDANALETIVEQRSRLIEDAKKKAEEWRGEITYEADVGVIFKDKLRISPEGIEWKGNRWDLDSITRVRWGGTRHSVNGIPTGTSYSIVFGDDDFNYASIEIKKKEIYTNFIDRLWKAVGMRLLIAYLEGLRGGKKYQFGSSVVSDHGIDLERRKLFGSNERVFCRWEELHIWDGAGFFCIGKKDDKKVSMAFSYQNEDNIHVLEAAIRMFWKKGGDRLSSLLGD